MKKQFFYSFLVALFSIVGFTSCGGDDIPELPNPEMAEKPFTVTALGSNAQVWFTLKREDLSHEFFTEASLMYSYDEETWYDYDFDNPLTFKSKGSSIYFKAGSSDDPQKKNSSFRCHTEHYNYIMAIKLRSNNDIAISGNILSLLYGDNPGDKFRDENDKFADQFEGCKYLVSAADLVLPVNTTRESFSYTFEDCKKLKDAPVLRATKMSYECYYGMFKNCTALEVAPQLPATEMADRCYQGMFRGCKSLKTAPKLPAKTLDEYCYEQMFSECDELTTAPLIAATSITQYGACMSMFEYCPKLTSVKICATSFDEEAIEDMLYGAGNSTSKLYVPKGVADNEVLKAQIPAGWTVVEED